jgi:hypothetical protein
MLIGKLRYMGSSRICTPQHMIDINKPVTSTFEDRVEKTSSISKTKRLPIEMHS